MPRSPVTPPPTPLPTPELSGVRTRRWRDRLLMLGALGLLALAGVTPWDQLSRVLQGRRTLAGEPAYTPAHTPAWDAVDLEAVHTELLPRWSLAAARPGDVYDQTRESHAYGALAEAVAADENLAALIDELRTLERDPWSNSAEIQWVMWAWSRYLEPTGWRVEGGVMDPGDGAFLYLRAYRVIAQGEVLAGGAARRVRVVQQADYTSPHAGYLGHAGRGGGEGAILIAEELEAFTLDAVWPLLDEGLDRRRTGPERGWARAVRRELALALAPEHLATLQRTAAERLAAIEARRALERRTHCMDMRISRLPWDGFPPELVENLSAAVERDAEADCPAITADELGAMAARPEAAAPEALAGALEALIAVVARVPALHEAQHIADRDHEPRCDSCLTTATRELSAYLASFADPEVGALAFYQACRATHRSRGGHAEAVAEAARHILPRGCVNPPPADLLQRVAATREALLGSSSPPRVVSGFPDRLPLSQ